MKSSKRCLFCKAVAQLRNAVALQRQATGQSHEIFKQCRDVHILRDSDLDGIMRT